jgi:TonB family protein
LPPQISAAHRSKLRRRAPEPDKCDSRGWLPAYRILTALTAAKTRRFDDKTLPIDSIDGSSNEHSGKDYCLVHVVVDPAGKVRDARVTSSTVSAILDRDCLLAISRARFTPELQNGLPVEDSTDIAIYW